MDSEWTPCPDGEPQELRHPLGFRERNRCELELRVPLGDDDSGVCQVMLDERDDEVHVRVLVHREEECDRSRPRPRPHTDCPVRVWLEQPLGDRLVIDADTDQELLHYVPAYVNNVPRPDHGYHWGRPH
ncbi:MAG TPA: hypothetical protein VE127_09275 [Solirubrobacteraceae bacterium]|nr:hypothetical protein [Solirubrobacteraceae bacterium]